MFVSDLDCEVSSSPMFDMYVCVGVIEGLPFRQRKQAA